MSTRALVFCFFLAVYALIIYGQIRYGDEAERYFQARSIVARQTLEIPWIPGEGQTGVGGKPFNQFEMGYGALLIPLYAVGRAVEFVFPAPDQDWTPILVLMLSNPIITALTCVILFAFCRAMGMRPASAIWTTVIFGLGTLAVPYAKGLYREALQAFTLLAAVYATDVFRRTAIWKWLVWAGFAFGYLAFTKVANLALLPVFLVYLLLIPAPQKRIPHTVRVLGVFLLPLLALLTVQGIVNVLKFGNFFNIGPYNYGNPLPYFSLPNVIAGTTGLLFAPTKSLFVFAPPVILFFPAWFWFFRKDKIQAVFVLALVMGHLLFSGAYVGWDGGTYWGPRYLVEIVPLMILPLGFLLERGDDAKGRLWRIIVGFVFLLGLGVQALAALTSDREYQDVLGLFVDLAGAVDFLRHGVIDSLAFSLSPSDGWRIQPYGWALGLVIVLLGVWLLKRTREQAEFERGGIAVPSVVLTILFGVFVAFLVIPFADVRAAKGDTRFAAGNRFYAERRYCEAQTMYVSALSWGTQFERESRASWQEINPRASGPDIAMSDLTAQVSAPESVLIEHDPRVFLWAEGPIKISARSGAIDMETTTEFFDVKPNARYELYGWIKAEGVTGDGYWLGWYEDNAKWRQPRTLTFINGGTGTHGWQPFRQTITTLPTSVRALLKLGLSQATGTIWVDGVELIQVESEAKPLCVR
ncbi:MAG: hypothetical protein HY782_20800 [Chloroflexi bacterium]|nr:hypothetical protein [Chloroflexota bacterium]